MSATTVLAIAFAIGVIAGLRSLTAPAVVCWAAHLKWINLQETPLAFMGAAVTTYIFTALAVLELITDKLPKTPSRKKPGPLVARFVTGGLSGAAICVAAHQSLILGAVLGGLGGVVGAFVGYAARTGLVRALKVPDFVIALLEDAVAVGGGLFLVSRF
jgi:uncharacterized membrane protein